MLKKAGIKRIKQLSEGKNKTLLIRAHGSSVATLNKAKKSGYKIKIFNEKYKEVLRITKYNMSVGRSGEAPLLFITIIPLEVSIEHLK